MLCLSRSHIKKFMSFSRLKSKVKISKKNSCPDLSTLADFANFLLHIERRLGQMTGI